MSTTTRLVLWIAAMAAGVTWQTYDIATATEAPNNVVAAMSYIFLVGMLIGLAAGVVRLVALARTHTS